MRPLSISLHHEGIDATLFDRLTADHGVGNLVLDIPRADAAQTFAVRFVLELAHAVFGVAGNALAVVKLELLHERQASLLGLFQTCEHCPHRGNFQRVRRDVHAAHFAAGEVFLVDADLVVEANVVRHVDLDRAVAEGLHHFVALEALVLGLVGVAQNDFVDVRLRELLGLDGVLLRGTEQIVQERDVELEHFDELADAAIGDVELAVEVERSRVAVAAVHRDLAIVDVARQLRRVLVLLVLGLERADAHAILLAEHDAADLHVVHDLAPIALVERHEVFEDLSAEGIRIAKHLQLAVVIGRLERRIELGQHIRASFARNQHQRLLMHRALKLMRAGRELGVMLTGSNFAVLIEQPTERVHRSIGRAAVVLNALLQQSCDRALAAAHRAVQQQNALVGAVAFRGGSQEVHELHQREVEAENRISAVVKRITEERIANRFLLEDLVSLAALAHDGVVEPLIGVAHDGGLLGADVQVLPERAAPVMVLKAPTIKACIDAGDEVSTADVAAHGRTGFALHAAIIAQRLATQKATFVEQRRTERREARRVHREPPASMPDMRSRSAIERRSGTSPYARRSTRIAVGPIRGIDRQWLREQCNCKDLHSHQGMHATSAPNVPLPS